MCHTSHQSLFTSLWWITSSCVERERKAAQEIRSYLICERERCLWSISWWKCLSESRVRMSVGAQEQHKSDSLQWGRHVSGMSSVVAFRSLKMFTPNSFDLGLPQTFYLCVHSPHLILSSTQMRWKRCCCGVGKWGSWNNKSCQEHTRMRERCHRSPLLCHSSAFNKEICTDKGRRLQSVNVGSCQSILNSGI